MYPMMRPTSFIRLFLLINDLLSVINSGHFKQFFLGI